MPARKLKPIEERDPYAALVLEAWDRLEAEETYGVRWTKPDGSTGWCLRYGPDSPKWSGSLADAKRRAEGLNATTVTATKYEVAAVTYNAAAQVRASRSEDRHLGAAGSAAANKEGFK